MKYRHILIVGLILGLDGVAFGSHPYISDPGTLLDGFENVADWTVTGTGATAANDANFFKFGHQSIKLNAANGVGANMTKTASLNFSSGDGFSFWFYVPDKTKLSYISIYITSQTNWSKKFYISFPCSVAYGAVMNGWNWVVFSKSEFTNSGGENWNNTMLGISFLIAPITGQNVSVYFDDLRFGIVGQPKVIITFDGAWGSQINEAYPIMAANGQTGVEFVCTSLIGSGELFMTLSDLQTLKAAGWDISNHTATHKNLAAVSQEDMEADIDGGYDWLVANGFGNTAKFFAYPYGELTSFNDAVVTKLKQKHMLARTVVDWCGRVHFDVLNFDDLQYKLGSHMVTNTTLVANIQAKIDAVIERSGLLILGFHRIVDSDANEVTEFLAADFQAISDYLKTKQDAGLLEVITFSDYYNALIEWHGLPFCLEKPAMDFNGDCKVDFKDSALFAESWLECNLEPKSACWE